MGNILLSLGSEFLASAGAETAAGALGTAGEIAGAGKALGSIGKAAAGGASDMMKDAGKNLLFGTDGAKALDDATKFLPKTGGDAGGAAASAAAGAATGKAGFLDTLYDRAATDVGDWWGGVKVTEANGWQMPGTPASGAGLELPDLENGGGWEAGTGVMPKETPVETTDWGATGGNLAYEGAKAVMAKSFAGSRRKSNAAQGTIPDAPLPEVPEAQTYAPNAEDELNKLRARMQA